MHITRRAAFTTGYVALLIAILAMCGAEYYYHHDRHYGTILRPKMRANAITYPRSASRREGEDDATLAIRPIISFTFANCESRRRSAICQERKRERERIGRRDAVGALQFHRSTSSCQGQIRDVARYRARKRSPRFGNSLESTIRRPDFLARISRDNLTTVKER